MGPAAGGRIAGIGGACVTALSGVVAAHAQPAAQAVAGGGVAATGGARLINAFAQIDQGPQGKVEGGLSEVNVDGPAF